MFALKTLSRISKSKLPQFRMRSAFEQSKMMLPCRYFTQTEPNRKNTKDGQQEHYKQDFENLKQKLNSEEAKRKMGSESFENLKQNVYTNIKYGKNVQKDEVAEQARKEHAENQAQSQQQQQQQQQSTDESLDKVEPTSTKEDVDTQGEHKSNEEEKKQTTWRSSLRDKSPLAGKVVDFCSETWQETFPSENYERKKEAMRRKAREMAQKRAEEEARAYTEEELEKLQENIPDWKRTSLTTVGEGEEEKPSLAKRLKGQLANRINQTPIAKKVYSSEEYKDYDEFKKEMTQFRADLKDHMHQSRNPLVQGSVTLIDKAKSESGTAKAIKEMRRIDPSFDIYDLEFDAKGIFNDVYHAYLEGDLNRLEKQCADMALGYFKTLLKKREVDKVEPKFKTLLDIDNASLVGGKIPDNKYPMFTFTIKTQEIHCNVSKKENKIVDGAEDRIMHCQYNFVLTPHQTPDLEEIGHGWEMVEVTMLGNVKALV